MNKHLLKDLIERGYWNEELKELLIAANGSVQNIDGLPEDLKELYKTAYEIKQRTIIDLSADRGAFICKSQSMNLFVEAPNFAKLSSMHFHAWKSGLKTGMYYLRSRAAAEPIKFTLSSKYQQKFVSQTVNQVKTVETVESTKMEHVENAANSAEGISCSLDNPDECIMCGS